VKLGAAFTPEKGSQGLCASSCLPEYRGSSVGAVSANHGLESAAAMDGYTTKPINLPAPCLEINRIRGTRSFHSSLHVVSTHV
jgi:hypothetical protein